MKPNEDVFECKVGLTGLLRDMAVSIPLKQQIPKVGSEFVCITCLEAVQMSGFCHAQYCAWN